MIDAFLDQDEPEVYTPVIAQLEQDGYQNIADTLKIDIAEKSILEEVSAVDGDEDENEQEELQEEEQTRALFQSLYEIDPETKEVFVRGSAYDLKKWDEDMICFAFGDEIRGIALEAAISPEERYLTRLEKRFATKLTKLNNVLKKHQDLIKRKQVMRGFAEDFRSAMGYPIPNIRMESFTNSPSGTNYALAMEEMSTQQAALIAGGALVGIGIVYKLIQWFAKALNRNSLATNSIGANFSAYFDRKEQLKNVKSELKIAKEEISKALNSFKDAYNTNVKDIDKSVANLKSALEGQDPEKVYQIFTSSEVKNRLSGKITPFIKLIIEGKLPTQWWERLDALTKESISAQEKIGAAISTIESNNTLDRNKPEVINFNFLKELNTLMAALEKVGNSNGFTLYNPQANNWEACIDSFISVTDSLLTPFADSIQFEVEENQLNGFSSIPLNSFANFTDEYVKNLEKQASDIESLAKKTHGEDDVKDKSNKVEIQNKRTRVQTLVKEFKAVSNILRFVIRVRNQLGVLSVAVNQGSESSLGKVQQFFVSLGRSAAAPITAASNMASNISKGFNSGMETN